MKNLRICLSLAWCQVDQALQEAIEEIDWFLVAALAELLEEAGLEGDQVSAFLREEDTVDVAEQFQVAGEWLDDSGEALLGGNITFAVETFVDWKFEDGFELVF